MDKQFIDATHESISIDVTASIENQVVVDIYQNDRRLRVFEISKEQAEHYAKRNAREVNTKILLIVKNVVYDEFLVDFNQLNYPLVLRFDLDSLTLFQENLWEVIRVLKRVEN